MRKICLLEDASNGTFFPGDLMQRISQRHLPNREMAIPAPAMGTRRLTIRKTRNAQSQNEQLELKNIPRRRDYGKVSAIGELGPGAV